MSARNDGGPAFPTYESDREGHLYCTGAGMTMRDYFAAKALQGLVTRPGGIDPRQDAEFAYMIADAMIRAREAA